jgi:hypothetical protein
MKAKKIHEHDGAKTFAMKPSARDVVRGRPFKGASY